MKILHVAAIIFDLDGVLVDSRAAVEAAWGAWSREAGVAFELVERTIPGRRTRDAVALLAPGQDADAQAARIIAHEQRLAPTVTPIRGAAALLAALPAGRWGIATSGTNDIARTRLRCAGLPEPEVLVSAEMVARGKPEPDPYLRAAQLLGVAPEACAVFEDAPGGVTAATLAGCIPIGVLTWATPEVLQTSLTVCDLRDVRVTASTAGLQIEIGAAS